MAKIRKTGIFHLHKYRVYNFNIYITTFTNIAIIVIEGYR